MARLSTVALTAFLSAAVANAFVAPSVNTNICTQSACFARTALFAEESGSGSEAVFMADEGEADEDKTFEAVEKLGRGAAKVSNVLFCVQRTSSKNFKHHNSDNYFSFPSYYNIV